MNLDNRLQAVADFVPLDSSVADIGTDHGYLALHLYEKNSDRKIIAADLNAGPCEAARKTFAEAGVEDVAVRQGNGLEALSAGEVGCVCIAGMGGKLIADILANCPDVFAELKCAVLQPQNAASELRKWLLAHNWELADETLAKVDGRIYQIIKAQPSDGDFKEYTEKEMLAGPILLEKGHELLSEHVQGIIEGLSKVVSGLQKASELKLEQAVKLQKTQEMIEELKQI